MENLESNVEILKVFVNLVREVVTPETIIWKTSNSELTAQQLCNEIESGSELGLQYVSDVLRISRDFIRSMATRPHGKI